MTFVLDASVAIAAVRKTERAHAAALRRCMPLFTGRDSIVVPAIFEVEVVGALVRRGVAPATVSTLLRRHFAERTVVTLGPRAARAAAQVAVATRLRAADALYVWVAAREGLPLVTLGVEVLERSRLAGVMATAP